MEEIVFLPQFVVVEEIAVITHCFGLFVEEITLSHSMYQKSYCFQNIYVEEMFPQFDFFHNLWKK